MGDHPGARPGRTRVFAYGAVIVTVAVARLIRGDAPSQVIVSAVIFAIGLVLVSSFISRLAKVDSAATRQQMATRRVRVGGLALLGVGVAFAFDGIWQVAGLLVFLAAFFNGAIWFAQRYGQRPSVH